MNCIVVTKGKTEQGPTTQIKVISVQLTKLCFVRAVKKKYVITYK